MFGHHRGLNVFEKNTQVIGKKKRILGEEVLSL